MTVSTTINKITYIANGVNTNFTFSFASTGISSTIQVFLTDTSGNLTQLSQPSGFTVAFVAPIAPNPTYVGGSVTLVNPPANGWLVTIIRTLPLTQLISLANQGTLYQPVLETTDDTLTMLVQQLNELLGRAINVALSDPVPNPLPPVAQRANQGMGFDGNGNPIAIQILPAGTVSPAMQPVVNASTIAQAVNLLGLSNVTPEPSGVVKMFAGTSLPSGYLWCNGGTASRTGATATLFAAIGTTYGVGDGTTTFNLPDFRCRVPAGLDAMGGSSATNRLTSNTISGGSATLGNNNGNSGIEQNTISSAQMPSHFHSALINDPGHAHTYQQTTSTVNVGSTNVIVPIMPFSGLSTSTNTTGVRVWDGTTLDRTGTVGSGNPVNNVQPTIMINYIIKI